MPEKEYYEITIRGVTIVFSDEEMNNPISAKINNEKYDILLDAEYSNKNNLVYKVKDTSFYLHNKNNSWHLTNNMDKTYAKEVAGLSRKYNIDFETGLALGIDEKKYAALREKLKALKELETIINYNNFEYSLERKKTELLKVFGEEVFDLLDIRNLSSLNIDRIIKSLNNIKQIQDIKLNILAMETTLSVYRKYPEFLNYNIKSQDFANLLYESDLNDIAKFITDLTHIPNSLLSNGPSLMSLYYAHSNIGIEKSLKVFCPNLDIKTEKGTNPYFDLLKKYIDAKLNIKYGHGIFGQIDRFLTLELKSTLSPIMEEIKDKDSFFEKIKLMDDYFKEHPENFKDNNYKQRGAANYRRLIKILSDENILLTKDSNEKSLIELIENPAKPLSDEMFDGLQADFVLSVLEGVRQEFIDYSRRKDNLSSPYSDNFNSYELESIIDSLNYHIDAVQTLSLSKEKDSFKSLENEVIELYNKTPNTDIQKNSKVKNINFLRSDM